MVVVVSPIYDVEEHKITLLLVILSWRWQTMVQCRDCASTLNSWFLWHSTKIFHFDIKYNLLLLTFTTLYLIKLFHITDHEQYCASSFKNIWHFYVTGVLHVFLVFLRPHAMIYILCARTITHEAPFSDSPNVEHPSKCQHWTRRKCCRNRDRK